MRTDHEVPGPADLGVDVHKVAWVLDSILARSGGLPPYESLVDEEDVLTSYIMALLPSVQTVTDQMDHGTPEWHSRQRILDQTRDHIQGGLGNGLLSANTHVVGLARYCQFILKFHEADASGRTAATK